MFVTNNDLKVTMKPCTHARVDDAARCLVCLDCGAVGRVNPQLMRAMKTGSQIDGPVFWWTLPDGTIQPEGEEEA